MDYKEKILGFYGKNGRMPVYTEMMKLFGFKSKNAVFKIVQKLVDEGIMTKDAKGFLIPAKTFGDIPYLGLVEAGFPTMVDALTDRMNLEEYLVPDKSSSYILEVKGDSMIDEGIREGDLVIAERKKEPKDGDIVIAYVDGGWTMKFLRKQAGKTWLEPANKNYKPIYPKHDLQIAAVVKSVIRKY
ncbi:MAG: hypothetical protein KGH93_02200 [Patescibacteria group bacterium]|nr:hypothetical protein [Patescibacteria group bacterium]MDE1945989.1 hypothetical protein [Patescibacteria group bacterium]